MRLGLTFSAVVISLALFHYTMASADQCSPMAGSIFEKCRVAGYNQTFTLPFELSSKNKRWIEFFISYIVNLPKRNCSVAFMGETILCSVYAPSCTEGNDKPKLPCRRVCSEFMKRCRADIDPFWLEYYVGYCTLLPNKTASSGECFEPQGFEKYHNTSTTGLLEDKCNDRLVFPWCKGIGYDYSIVKEPTQISSYRMYYGKNFTNETDANTGANQSVISYWNKFLNNHSSCALEIRKMICADLFPPCFPSEGLAFYTICQSTCKSIESKCSNIGESSPFGKYLTYCEAVASGKSSHGYCKHTSWPKPLHWINFFRENPRPLTSPPQKGLSTPIIVVIVIVPLIVIGLVVLGVVLWRQRRLPWIDRFLKRAEDTKGFASEEPKS